MIVLYRGKKEINQVDCEQAWTYLTRKWAKLEHIILYFIWWWALTGLVFEIKLNKQV